MQPKYLFAGLTLALALLTPVLSSAHERQLINIGGTDYLFVVGSLGEPVVVDDKTGVELRVQIADPKDPTNSSALGAKPLLGLEQALKVEIIAGEKKKTFDLTTVYGTLGSYKAVFFPTVKTALTYRFTGTINNTPIDLSFFCAPEGSKAAEDKTEAVLGAGVTRMYKNGQFGCPMGKEELGFPEEGMSLLGLHDDIHGEMSGMMNDMMNDSQKGRASAALAFGLIGTLLGAIALWKSRTPKL
jgi:hypothetical protein